MTDADATPNQQPEGLHLSDVPVDEMVSKWQPIIEELIDDNLTATAQRAFRTGFNGITTEGIVLLDKSGVENILSDTYVWLLDQDEAGDLIGYGIVAADRETNTPYVGDIFTNQDYRRGGFAKRRLKIMNRIAKETFGNVLHSSEVPTIEPEAAVVWQKLEEKGEVESFETARGRRWKFKA